jgi:hypothetical protein
MNRRDAIKQTALLMGCAVSAPALASLLSGCQPNRQPDWIPDFFTPEQGQNLAELCERIIPATDTPGAKDVLVHRFIDQVLGTCYPAPARNAFRQGLDQAEGRCLELHQKSIAQCGPEELDALLTELAQQVATQKEEAQPGEPMPFFLALKEICIVGYLTSEVVGTELLAYDPVPQQYQGCIPIDKASGGRQWTLL